MTDHVDRTRLIEAGSRTIAVLEVGAPGAAPCIFHHGWPGSRLGVLGFADAANASGVRMIGLDRPGFGRSSPQPSTSLLDIARDVSLVADRLGIDRFAVAGLSGGGPAALACAAVLADRLTSVHVISGVTWWSPRDGKGLNLHNRVLLNMAARAAWSVRPIMAIEGAAMGNEATMRKLMAKAMNHAPATDREVLADETVREGFVRESVESFRQGSAAAAEELVRTTKAWPFTPADIAMPVHFWHGTEDRNVPISGVRRAADVINGANLTEILGGHLIMYTHTAQILGSIATAHSVAPHAQR